MRKVGLLLVLVAGCSKPKAVVDQTEASAPIVAAPAAPPRVRSFARFAKGQLQQCIDVIGDATPKLETALADEQPITKPCAKAFADRISLARCTVEIKTDAGTSKAAVAHYDFENVGLSDVAMSECLSLEGQWDPVPRDSPQFRRARLEHSQRKLQKAADSLTDTR